MSTTTSTPGAAQPRRPLPPLMTLTDRAAARLAALYAKGSADAKLLRIGVDAHGCSGLSYKMSWAAAPEPDDETVEDKGVTLLVERKASLFLTGTVMDYEVKELSSGFTFTNPNEKGRCGCGESFHV